MKKYFLKSLVFLTAFLGLSPSFLLANTPPSNSTPQDQEAGYACGDPNASLSSQPGIDPKVAELRRKFETSGKCE